MRDIADYALRYNEKSFENYQVKYRRRSILEFIDKNMPQRILEIGCGLEPLFQYIGTQYDLHYIVEPSELFCDNAQKLARTKCGGAKHIVVKQDYFEATDELKQQSFDAVICAGLLQELEDPKKMLEDIKEVSTKETLVYFNVANSESVHRKLALVMGLIKDTTDLTERNQLFQQHSVFNMRTISETVNKCGFEILDIGTMFIKPFTHDQMYQMLNAGIINEEILDGLYLLGKEPEYAGLGSEIYMECRKK